MPQNQLETDYLVVGSGTMGMAFVDALVAESNADVILVDRHHRPGGHWNDAYPFLRLLMQRFRNNVMPAVVKLQQFLEASAA